MKIAILFVTLFNIMIIPFAFSGTIRHDVEDKKYVEYGESHGYVFKLAGIIEENGQEVPYYGSCTAVSGKWVITAAHVVRTSKKNFLIIEIKDGEKVHEKQVLVEKKIIHPDFHYASYGPSDLALCKLQDDLKLERYPELYEETNELGKICSMAGYGKTGTGLTGATKDGNKKRGGSNKIEYTSEESIYCVMSSESPTELEFLISHGDSGGGLFINGKLAGVHSSVRSTNGRPDSNYGDESCHTRISHRKHLDWIISTMKNN